MHGSVTPAMLAILLLSTFAAGQEGREASGGRGQLRSFAAIRTSDLAPPLPGTEEVYREIAELLKAHDEPYLKEQVEWNRASWYHAPDRRPDWGPTPTRAKCTLRGDLPKPRYLGLECRDADGQYIGTLRAKSGRELRSELESLCFGLHTRGSVSVWQGAVAVPGTLPLHEYRYIYVTFDWAGYREHAKYLAELLGADGFWRVVSSTDSVPPEDTERMLECRFRTWSSQMIASESHMGRASLYLADSGRRPVREITGFTDWFGGEKAAIRAAVRRLVEARRLDEEIHRPLAEAPRR